MISTRLESLSKYFDKNDKVVDIGCDHALLDIYLVQNKIVKSMIAADVNEGALNQGIENIKRANLEKKIETRLGNGLEVLTDKDDIDTVLISGMGATTITTILSNSYTNKLNKLVIQSNNDHELLRKEVTKLGFEIKEEEFLIDNKKAYITIVFVRGNKTYSKDELKYGVFLVKDKDYLKYQIDYYTSIYNKIPSNKLFIKMNIKKIINKLKKYEKNIK